MSNTLIVIADLLNLFIDLLWVGILSNVADEFVSTAFKQERGWGTAFLEYFVLFLTAFRFWNYIRTVGLLRAAKLLRYANPTPSFSTISSTRILSSHGSLLGSWFWRSFLEIKPPIFWMTTEAE